MIQEIYPHRFNNKYLPERKITAADFVLFYQGNTILLKKSGSGYELPRKSDFSDFPETPEPIFLFTLDEVPCFLLQNDPGAFYARLVLVELGFFRTTRQLEIAWVSLAGRQLANWYVQRRFCGTCGERTIHKSDERALLCPKCAQVFYPVIAPAVIVAIRCNDKILLARGSEAPGGWYSLLAGYVDAGESLEEALVREVKEEVGIAIHNIQYYSSQPWPPSGSIMIGFTAEADDNQPLEVDHREIAEAAWFRRGNLPRHPPALSIAGEMIEKFEQGVLDYA